VQLLDKAAARRLQAGNVLAMADRLDESGETRALPVLLQQALGNAPGRHALARKTPHAIDARHRLRAREEFADARCVGGVGFVATRFQTPQRRVVVSAEVAKHRVVCGPLGFANLAQHVPQDSHATVRFEPEPVPVKPSNRGVRCLQQLACRKGDWRVFEVVVGLEPERSLHRCGVAALGRNERREPSVGPPMDRQREHCVLFVGVQTVPLRVGDIEETGCHDLW
jgi:hypothetical protein